MTAATGLRIIGTIMALSFTSGLVGMFYDVFSAGVSDRAARMIMVAYLWPVGVVGLGVFAIDIAAIWGVLP